MVRPKTLGRCLESTRWNGYIAVLGRYDDVLNVAGHRIGTAEVESALVSHPAVAEAAAIGVPDPCRARPSEMGRS